MTIEKLDLLDCLNYKLVVFVDAKELYSDGIYFMSWDGWKYAE